jgi:ABC-type sulfate/molybdate transport systems ATPase subunit
MQLEVNIQAQLGEFKLDLRFESQARCLALFGPSGAGKSLCLHAIAGLFTPDSGHIRLGPKTLFGKQDTLAPQDRRMGLVPQGSALFPHLTVRENIGFGASDPQDVDPLAERFGLSQLLDQPTGQLSGGEAQRVALARAMATRPQLLLLDEPFSGVDTQRRTVLFQALSDTVDAGTPLVFVTHDLQNVLHLADEVALLDQGEVLQIGSTESVLEAPASLRAAKLFDGGQLFSGSDLGLSSPAPIFIRTEWLRPLHPKEAPLPTEHLVEGEIQSQRRGPQSQEIQIRLDSGAELRASLPLWWWSAQIPEPTRLRLAILREKLRPLPQQ